MQLLKISFNPIASVVLTPEEMIVCLECSEVHYDAVCKQASRVGGFLYGMKNCTEFKPDYDHSLTWRQLDILAEIAEMGAYLETEKAKIAFGIGLAIKRIFSAMENATPEPVECNCDA